MATKQKTKSRLQNKTGTDKYNTGEAVPRKLPREEPVGTK